MVVEVGPLRHGIPPETSLPVGMMGKNGLEVVVLFHAARHLRHRRDPVAMRAAPPALPVEGFVCVSVPGR